MRIALPVPELDMLDSDGAQLRRVMRIEFHVEHFVLVASSVDQRLLFAPIPNDQRMVVIETDRSEKLVVYTVIQDNL